jgi:transcriptional regulator with XRE-family HTH domain
MRIFSKRLKELRHRKKLSQEELAEKMNIPRTTIAGYESGARSLPREQRLKVIAQYFQVSIDYLIGISDEENESQQFDQQIINIIRSSNLYYNNEYSYSNAEKEQIITMLLNLANMPNGERKVVLEMLSRMARRE